MAIVSSLVFQFRTQVMCAVSIYMPMFVLS